MLGADFDEQFEDSSRSASTTRERKAPKSDQDRKPHVHYPVFQRNLTSESSNPADADVCCLSSSKMMSIDSVQGSISPDPRLDRPHPSTSMATTTDCPKDCTRDASGILRSRPSRSSSGRISTVPRRSIPKPRLMSSSFGTSPPPRRPRSPPWPTWQERQLKKRQEEALSSEPVVANSKEQPTTSTSKVCLPTL